MKRIELLAPAGDLEKLKIAVEYGADAVYFGGSGFSLRSGAGCMTPAEIAEGVEFAHSRGCRTYLAVNIFAHNEDIEHLPAFLDEISDIPVDAFLISDPGVYEIFREKRPGAELHLSTQANNTNYKSAEFWYHMGVKRVVAARELSFEELREFRSKIPAGMEIEAFVHGAMCISYSGRCLLSNFLASRDANRGLCAHPCRWNYALMEEKRPGEYFSVDEDERGTYVFNSKDLCMIRHIPEIIESGIASAKIEGRMKSIFYLATVVRVYRTAIDAYYNDPGHFVYRPEWLGELSKVSNRHFTTGFFLGRPDEEAQNYESGAYIREYDFIGIVREFDDSCMTAVIEQRNNFRVGDEIEIFGPGSTDFFTFRVTEMTDARTGESLEVAPHAQQLLKIRLPQKVRPDYMLRRRSL